MRKVISSISVIVLVCLLIVTINQTDNKSKISIRSIKEIIHTVGGSDIDNQRGNSAVLDCVAHQIDLIDGSDPVGATYYRSKDGIVFRTDVVYVNITPSFFFPSKWKDAIHEAVAEYNRLNLRIRFEITNSFFVLGSDADKTVQVEYIDFEEHDEFRSSSESVAIAKFPYNGWPGKTLHINSGTFTNQKKRTIMHELGHSIGIGHTGDQEDDTVEFFTGIICGEPINEHSIFYRALTPPFRTGFSDCDKEALYTLYGRR